MRRILYSVFFLVLLMMVFAACRQEKVNTNQELTPESSAGRGFNRVTIPDSLVSPEERATYLVTRYWDNFDFSDTAYIHTPEITEQAFVDYLSVFPHTRRELVETSIDAMLTRTIAEDATGKIYPYFLDLYKQYLYDSGSPMRSEEFYIPVAEYIIGNPVNDLSTKEQAQFDLSVMLKNRQGTVATDFNYITDTGAKGALHKLNKSYTILYFHNPDCSTCEETAHFLNKSSLLNRLLQSGKLDILALYADDDLELWNRYANRLPVMWINARDEPHIVRSKAIYELRAMPTLYLLDKNKKVLLKDIDAMAIEAFFISLPSK